MGIGPLALGCALLAAYVAVAWRLPAQAPPMLSHAGFRWRLWHVDRLGFAGAAGMLATLAVLWVGWAVIGTLMLSLTGDRDGRLLLGALGGASYPPPLLLLPALSVVAALLTVPIAARRAFTDVQADPACIVLRRPWPWPATTVPWKAVRGVTRRTGQLVLQTTSGAFVLEAPRAASVDLDRIGAWIEVGRASAREPEPPQAPPPRELRRLVRASVGTFSRGAGRSARRTPAA